MCSHKIVYSPFVVLTCTPGGSVDEASDRVVKHLTEVLLVEPLLEDSDRSEGFKERRVWIRSVLDIFETSHWPLDAYNGQAHQGM
jgi:hypothetical protein